jgi:hypothetical protein
MKSEEKMEPLEKQLPDEPDLKPFFRYLDQLTNDPLRIKILVTHVLIEEMIENVIAAAVPNSECFNVPKMPFERKLKILRSLVPSNEIITRLLGLCESLNKLRNAAAHQDYDTLREQRFRELATLFQSDFPVGEPRDKLLSEVAKTCFLVLL